MRTSFSKTRMGLLALCALALSAPSAGAQTDAKAQTPPPPVLLSPVMKIPAAQYEGFRKVGPCMYAALGPARQKALLDAYRLGGHRAYAGQMDAYGADLYPIAQRCNPRLSSQGKATAMLLNVYTEQTVALALLNEFGVTQDKLDAVKDPVTAPLMADFHASAVVSYTGNESDRTAPTLDSPEVFEALLRTVGLPAEHKAIGGQAIIAYYIGRESVSVLYDNVKP